MAESLRFRAPAATQDILPPESARWEALLAHFATQMADAGYGLLQSPMFEEIGVFQRVGEGTDVVRKEMYEFTDRGDRRKRLLTLTPTGTALENRLMEKQSQRIADAFDEAGAAAADGFRDVLRCIIDETDRERISPPGGAAP